MSIKFETDEWVVIHSKIPSIEPYNGEVCRFLKDVRFSGNQIIEYGIGEGCIVVGPKFPGLPEYGIQKNHLLVPKDDLIKLSTKNIFIGFETWNNNEEDQNHIDWLRRYLTDEEMEATVQRIFEARLTKQIDRIIESCGKWYTKSYFDRVLSAIAESYISKFEGKYDEQLKSRIEQIIAAPMPESGDYNNFFTSAKDALEDYTRKYINNHPDEIKKLVWDRVEESAKNISGYSIESAIKRTVDIDGILKRLIEEGTRKES